MTQAHKHRQTDTHADTDTDIHREQSWGLHSNLLLNLQERVAMAGGNGWPDDRPPPSSVVAQPAGTAGTRQTWISNPLNTHAGRIFAAQSRMPADLRRADGVLAGSGGLRQLQDGRRTLLLGGLGVRRRRLATLAGLPGALISDAGQDLVRQRRGF